ncbi:MAG: signal peptidase I [Nitrososphaerota archaeon]|nr:signal peptidase I [Nitrososphaerota archaeon]
MNRKLKESLNLLLNTILIPMAIIILFISLLTTVMRTDSPLAVVEIDDTPWYVSSMYPTLYPGDLLLLTRGENLKIGDIIVYRSPYDKNKNIVHRIINIIVTSTGEKRYVTKGDHNSSPDWYYPTDRDIVGKWTGFKIHLVGFIFLLLDSPPLIKTPFGEVSIGRVILIIVLVVVLVLEIIEIFRKK